MAKKRPTGADYTYRRTTISIAGTKMDVFNMTDIMHCKITTRRSFLLVTCTRGT